MLPRENEWKMGEGGVWGRMWGGVGEDVGRGGKDVRRGGGGVVENGKEDVGGV